MTTITKCAKCGGISIQVLAWVDPDTGIYIADSGGNGIAKNWCSDCEEHVDFIKVDETDEKDSGDIFSNSWANKADDKSERGEE